jgi:16S rRNA A1518/A1519 N6-dimethyltransferase RsmA/KsgA/DIM1 with predicted DNA glycosylase/AP lyase activity
VKSWFQKNKISPTQRAETLNIRNWVNLTKTFQRL